MNEFFLFSGYFPGTKCASLGYFLPLLDITVPDIEKRMRNDFAEFFSYELSVAPGISLFEFGQEMVPFELHLAARDREAAAGKIPIYLLSVESISSAHSVFIHPCQILIDAIEWMRARLETRQLRMIFVAPGLALKNFLGQQGLSPQGDQAFGVQVLWVQ